MFVVRKQFDNTEVLRSNSIVTVARFVANAAKEMNYGIYRTWKINNVEYYDYGPVTFCVYEI